MLSLSPQRSALGRRPISEPQSDFDRWDILQKKLAGVAGPGEFPLSSERLQRDEYIRQSTLKH
jgi:hypothetical protein